MWCQYKNMLREDATQFSRIVIINVFFFHLGVFAASSRLSDSISTNIYNSRLKAMPQGAAWPSHLEQPLPRLSVQHMVCDQMCSIKEVHRVVDAVYPINLSLMFKWPAEPFHEKITMNRVWRDVLVWSKLWLWAKVSTLKMMMIVGML